MPGRVRKTGRRQRLIRQPFQATHRPVTCHLPAPWFSLALEPVPLPQAGGIFDGLVNF
jgi:hypothetical protein